MILYLHIDCLTEEWQAIRPLESFLEGANDVKELEEAWVGSLAALYRNGMAGGQLPLACAKEERTVAAGKQQHHVTSPLAATVKVKGGAGSR